jgi:hypothetical protein
MHHDPRRCDRVDGSPAVDLVELDGRSALHQLAVTAGGVARAIGELLLARPPRDRRDPVAKTLSAHDRAYGLA